jgi:hypothetical protein
MRARDVRAIAFCSITTVLVLALSWLLLGSPLVSLALTGAYAVWLLTRPRMQRVIGRLRGEPDWSGYFSNREVEIKPKREPGTTGPSPRPAERR